MVNLENDIPQTSRFRTQPQYRSLSLPITVYTSGKLNGDHSNSIVCWSRYSGLSSFISISKSFYLPLIINTTETELGWKIDSDVGYYSDWNERILLFLPILFTVLSCNEENRWMHVTLTKYTIIRIISCRFNQRLIEMNHYC